jgi:hypothetical protein
LHNRRVVQLGSQIQAGELATGLLPQRRTDVLSNLLALTIGVVMTFCVCGYQFGKSNHTVYLLDATHRSYPNLLDNDWFTTQTFQYHATYGFITRFLMRAHILEPGFLVAYVGLVIAFHVAWMGIVSALGGTTRTYLVSVLFYYLSAGGTGLGIYQFFQDSCFLPSNISNVALLWAFYLWIVDRRVWSAVCFGVAGLFHLNYAIVGVGAWCSLNAWEWIGPAIGVPAMQERMQGLVTRVDPKEHSRKRTYTFRCWVAAIVPSMFNIFMGVMLELHRGGKMPFAQFLEIYVKFRHPHHYYPRSWPLALWICFLWPIPFAFFAWRILQQKMDLPVSKRARREAVRIFALMAGLQIVALIGAGYFYFSETLVQMSLYRFSIYVSLFACIGAAILVSDCTRITGASSRAILIGLTALIVATPLLMRYGPRVGVLHIEGVAAFINAKRKALMLFFVLSCAPAVHESIWAIHKRKVRNALNAAGIAVLVVTIVIGWNRWIGLTLIIDKTSPDYLAVCDWAREHTPEGAIFLVPPEESEFRLRAQRAIVVNFKCVPQLDQELIQWDERLRDVLGLTNLYRQLPNGFDKIPAAMARIYSARTGDELFIAAKKYDARYVVASHGLGSRFRHQLVYESGNRYFLYDLDRS